MQTNWLAIAKRIVAEICRIIVALTFLFSGFVKSVDPMGTVYKLQDYFAAVHLSLPLHLVNAFAFVLCGVEFILGAFLLFGLYRHLVTKVLLVVMVLMTGLTLWIAFFNPVKDCGCFGDALILTNWQTFGKNIILLICTIFVFLSRSDLGRFYSKKSHWLGAFYVVLFIAVFIARNFLSSPPFDFRPYKAGADLSAMKDVKVGAGHKEKTILIYAKNGKQKAFSQTDFPWQDSTWHFVRMESKVIAEGETSPIEDFSVTRLYFDRDENKVVKKEDITGQILSDSSYVFLMVAPSMKDMNISTLINLEDIRNYAYDHHYHFYCLTASDETEISEWAQKYLDDFDFCIADKRTLETIVRSNPGLVLLKNGVVYKKWSSMDMPEATEFKGKLSAENIGKPENLHRQNKWNLIIILAVFFVPLIGIKELDLSVEDIVRTIEKEI